MRITNITRNTIISENCKAAETFFSRFIGLMGANNLDPGNGLLIKPCNSIHMFFMKFPLDVIFLDNDGKVVHLIEGIKPWGISPVIHYAHSTLELPCGTIKASLTQKGDFIYFS